jgi:riboflavin-specific deaminase-like protein
MAVPGNAHTEPPQQPAAAFKRLLPPGEQADARTIADALDFQGLARADGGRPYVILNMASTVDGRASIGGRSGSIGDRADRELFHALRASVDAVMAGAGTVRVERYGRIIPRESARVLRLKRGLSEEPLACVVTGRLSLPPDTPLLCEPAAHVVLITPSASSLPETPARLDYVRARRDGRLDLPTALAELSERFAVRTLLCEGGPHLNAELLLAGLVDELLLSFSPKLAGGENATGEALRIVAGAQFAEPLELELLSVLESASTLFLRYGVRASVPERVSRETMPSSSLAS